LKLGADQGATETQCSLRSPSRAFPGGPRDPLFSFVVRAAAANVNPRTRLSHVTYFIVCDWCTRERCRPVMQKSQIFPEFPADDSQNFAAGSRIPQDFPRKSEAPPPTPLRPGACCTEASCVTHWILVRDPLKPSARSTEACPGELTPHHSPMDQGSDFRAMLSLSRPVPSKFRHPVLCCRLFVALLWSP
jgi:hypothetical protein